jgi:hypothetical protein
LLPIVVAAAAVGLARAADEFTPEPGFVSLFNGKDLSGWKYGNDPLDGKIATADGRFVALDGVLVVKGPGPGEPAKTELDTARRYDRDFVLRLEFRATPKANSGLHVRDKAFPHQLQIRDYPTAGPYNDLKKYKNGDWNALEVTVKADPSGKSAALSATCNGESLETAMPVPTSGPLSLQSETNVIEYRRIRVKEAPATGQ